MPKPQTNIALDVIQKYGNQNWDKDTAQKALDDYIDALKKQGDDKSVLSAEKKRTSSPANIQYYIYNGTLKREGLAII
jgi:hypothetical protein